jgi:hypothetical protein
VLGGLGVRGDVERGARSSRTSRLREEGRRPYVRRSTGRRPADDARQAAEIGGRSRTRRPDRAAGRRRSVVAAMRALAARRRGSSRCASAAGGDDLRRPAHRSTDLARAGGRGRLRGALRASSWSTSSRTPTRCSGTSCAARSARERDARAHRRPQAGDLRLPRRGRLRLPRRRAAPTTARRSGRTGAATRG